MLGVPYDEPVAGTALISNRATVRTSRQTRPVMCSVTGPYPDEPARFPGPPSLPRFERVRDSGVNRVALSEGSPTL